MPFSTDIYSTREAIDDLKQQFIEEEDPETLELSTYGFLGASLAKMTSATIRVASEKANEVFYSKARLQSSIYMHSKQNEIDVVAIPAHINILLCLVEEDITRLFEKATDNFIVIDSACVFEIGEYEYHLDYPIIISRRTMVNNQTVYTARYDISDVNVLSDIVNPYLPSPYLIKNNGYTYLYIACGLRQVQRTVEYTKLVTNSVIENKTYEFSYDKQYQLAGFDIYVTEGENTVRLFPHYEGEAIENESSRYCWYQYIDAYTIRIKFDSASYMPGINAEIATVIYTTEGTKCNMSYTQTILQNLSDTEKYIYDGVQVMIIPQGDSIGALDAPTLLELKRKLPKEALSRGSISNEKDLENFLNRISTDYIRTKSSKKVDNQFMRSYFVYTLAKDQDLNVVPTNTINVIANESDFDDLIMDEVTQTPVQYILKQGCYIGYNSDSHYGAILKDPTEEDLKNYDFIYTIPFKAVVSKEGPYISYLMTVMNNAYMTYFSYINDYTPLQFICSGVKWNRSYNGENSYLMDLTLTQNIASDFGVVTEDAGNPVSNLKVIAMCYNADGIPYRYFIGEMVDYDIEQAFSYTQHIKFETNDIVDSSNRIRIENGYAVNQDTVQYGYFAANTQVKLYVLCKFKDSEGGGDVEYGRYDLDSYVGGLEGYSCTNVYDVLGGIDFFDNFTENISSTVSITEEGYKILGIPVIKRGYATKEEKFLEFVSYLKDIKRFVDDEAKPYLEGMGIDLKFYNTYGPARLYTIDGETNMDRVNVSLKFNLALRKASDDYTKDYILKDIKTDIESLDSIDSYHMPVLISAINKKYENSIYYLEFKGFNNYSTDYQHFYASESEDVSDVPEFICINQLDDGMPDITINIVE